MTPRRTLAVFAVAAAFSTAVLGGCGTTATSGDHPGNSDAGSGGSGGSGSSTGSGLGQTSGASTATLSGSVSGVTSMSGGSGSPSGRGSGAASGVSTGAASGGRSGTSGGSSGSGSSDAGAEASTVFCLFNGGTYPSGSWFPGELFCSVCGCRDGNVGCSTPGCAPLPGPGSSCTYFSPQGSATYASGTTWTCTCGQTCLCYDGQPLLMCADGGSDGG
jgi:hypothetical protein